MRNKAEILEELRGHTKDLDPQHKELADIAIIETEVQLDIRDQLHDAVYLVGLTIDTDFKEALKKSDLWPK